MPPLESNAPDTRQLAQLIENEKCALVLGPFANPDVVGAPLHTLLAREIAAEVERKIGSPFPAPDKLALACSAYMQQPATPRLGLEMLVRDFYRRHQQPSELLREVARLPFRLVFTTAHDDLLQKAFLEEKKRSFKDGYYRFSKTQTDDYDTTPEHWTYLYQLFGRVQLNSKPDDSLVLTQADQLAYMDSVQGVGRETRLPMSLQRAMQEDCESFLFLGFDYDDWYLRVLFHILKVSEKAKLLWAVPEGASANLIPETAAYFQQQYRFSFFKKDPVALLRGVREYLHADGLAGESSKGAAGHASSRKLLFLHAEADSDIKNKLDRQLALVKKTQGLESLSIHDILPGDNLESASNRLVDSASVIVPIISADFFADENLSNALLQRALARQSNSVCVAAVYARACEGWGEIFRGKAPVFPHETLPLLGLMQEDAAYSMVAKSLEQIIAALRYE
ncbi:MAG: SIR2 family protein [Saprospiraceae bacterium]